MEYGVYVAQTTNAIRLKITSGKLKTRPTGAALLGTIKAVSVPAARGRLVRALQKIVSSS